MDRQVVIVGAGFAGSLLARILATQGLDVLLLERGRHPRFAIGESSTPLANLCLERLAKRYGFRDLHHLANHGRWQRHHPDLGCGLKRGFTFYHHQVGRCYRPSERTRLMVAASPSADVADTQWLRADLDHYFVRQAEGAGVDYRDLVTVDAVRHTGKGIRLTGRWRDERLDVRAGFVVDATGPAGFVARRLGVPSALGRVRTRSSLLFGHFRGVRRLASVTDGGFPGGPYPDEWAAVHHVFSGGWMYSLRFDDGLVSAGALLEPGALAQAGDGLPERDPTAAWRAVLGRLPSVAEQFARAAIVRPIEFRRRVQHRLARAEGPRLAVLPHTYAFVDPLFSTGIAWSLIGVERLALAFEAGRGGQPAANDLSRYGRLLDLEATQVDRLIAGAYSAFDRFRLFAAQAMLYFAAVSWTEVRTRLGLVADPAWSAFLGADDPVLAGAVAESGRRIRRKPDSEAFEAWVRSAIAPRNLVGLADSTRGNRYPVDNRDVLRAHELLGLSRARVQRLLPRLTRR